MVETLQWKSFSHYFAPRAKDTHKGQAGHVVIVGGFLGMSGSVRLSAMGAFRVGAGLVSIASHPDHAALLNMNHPEIMCHAIATPSDLDPLFAKASVIVLGPGLGQAEWSKKIWQYTSQQNKPLIIDADGLNLLAANPTRRDNWILTPHAGEAGRLLGKTNIAIQSDREAAISAIAQKFGGVCVLKGASTLVHENNGNIFLCDKGNPGLATAGTGDVLAGILGGLVGQGLTLIDAASAGVLMHALAADRSAKECGERGMMASDLFPYLRQLANLK